MAYPFTTTATFYTETPGTGEMTTVYAADFACRLNHVAQRPANPPDRAALAAERDLMFDPAIILPQFGEIVIAGHDGRWAPKAYTYEALRGPTGALHHRRVQVVRQVE
jgi:hypothetical protein